MAKKNNLSIAHSGEEIPKTDNIVIDIKMFLNKSYKFRRNLISRNIELNGFPIDDIVLNSVYVSCKTTINKATKDLVNSIIFSEFIPVYNPFLDFFEKHNGKEPAGYIDRLIKSIGTDTENYELFIKKWLVSIIGSINGNHSPLLLVLTGPQNTGKTHWFRHLLPKELLKYYAESKLDLGKDDEILMTKKLIIMDDEMGGKNKAEQKKLKEMTSKQIFSVREPYGRISLDLHRLAVLCGTTNDEELLNDPTGNRRILPVRVIKLDWDMYNDIDKDMLFYEIYLLYQSGYSQNLNAEEITTLNNSTDVFKQSNGEEELVYKYYSVPAPGNDYGVVYKTNSEILSYIQMASNLRLSQTKLGLVLKQIGFEQIHKKINNSTIRVYRVIVNDLSTSTTYEPQKPIEKEEIIQLTDDEIPF